MLLILRLARGLGLEPRFTASKAAVLPLDDPRAKRTIWYGQELTLPPNIRQRSRNLANLCYTCTFFGLTNSIFCGI